MITHHIPLILSSSTASGAINKSSDGSFFQVSLENGLLIPYNAKQCWIVCQAAEVWNTSPNIITGKNDLIYFNDVMGALLITIPQGLYDLTLLNAEINRQIVDSGRDSDTIVILGNSATQKTYIQFQDIGASVDFTQPQTIRTILGFDSIIVGPSVSANELFMSQEEASFNNIDYFIIHTDLVSRGIRINNKYSQAVAQVLIDASPGSQIVSQPNNPPEIPAFELIGDKKTILNVWLTDQDNNRVFTAGEDFSLRLVIYYIA